MAKDGFEIERKRIDIPGVTVKSVGKYTVTVRLYESETAEFPLIVEAQKEADTGAAKASAGKAKKDRRNAEAEQAGADESADEQEPAEQAETEEAVEQPVPESTENTDEAAGSENAAE